MLDLEACYQPVQNLDVNAVADGYVIYDAERDRVHYLNPTAVILLELCNGQIKTKELPELVRSLYELPETPTKDVHECLEKLLEEGLVR